MSYANKVSSLAVIVIIASTSFLAGCAVRAGYYDGYYHDRHRWAEEEPYYNRWEHDTHRRHEEFRRRHREEQREYWQWRHNQH